MLSCLVTMVTGYTLYYPRLPHSYGYMVRKKTDPENNNIALFFYCLMGLIRNVLNIHPIPPVIFSLSYLFASIISLLPKWVKIMYFMNILKCRSRTKLAAGSIGAIFCLWFYICILWCAMVAILCGFFYPSGGGWVRESIVIITWWVIMIFKRFLMTPVLGYVIFKLLVHYFLWFKIKLTLVAALSILQKNTIH